MPDICILENYWHSYKSANAHLRNSYILAKELGADLIQTRKDFKRNWNKKYEHIILAYGSHYMPHKEWLHYCVNNPDAQVYWLTNEYDIMWPLNTGWPDPRQAKAICNFEKKDNSHNFKRVESYHTYDLNLLLARESNPLVEKKYDCIYYGTFRKDRSRYFARYLQKPIYLSTSIKNFKKYHHVGCRPNFIEPLQWKQGHEILNKFRYSLYIEDAYTHEVYNHLANRFYECLFCNVVQFFDIHCQNTIKRSGIEFDDFFYVRDHLELMDKIRSTNGSGFEELNQRQQQWLPQSLKKRKRMIDALKKFIADQRK